MSLLGVVHLLLPLSAYSSNDNKRFRHLARMFLVVLMNVVI